MMLPDFSFAFPFEHWNALIVFLAWVVLIVGLFQNFLHVLQLPFAWIEIRQNSHAHDNESPWHLLLSKTGTPISILVPAYNEEASIVDNIHSLLALKYANFELIVVNDGSTDNTLQRMIDAFALKPVFRAHETRLPHETILGIYGTNHHPNFFVINKENAGNKADALNAALNFSRNPLFCVIDADSLLEPEALLRSVRPFMENPEHMVAVGGTIRVLNGCTVANGQIKKVTPSSRFLPLVQTMEYIRSFLIARLAWSRWGILTIVSGAFGIFSRHIALEVGGFSSDTVGEDYDLIIKIHRAMIEADKPYRIRYVSEPVCWTYVPNTGKALGAQRRRWQRGALEVFFKNRDLFFQLRYGRIGMISFLIHFVTDLLGPLTEMAGYILIPLGWLFGTLSTPFFMAFLAVYFLFGTFISLCALVLEEMELRRYTNVRDLLLLSFAALAENFGYRQLNNIWRIIGWVDFLRGRREWGSMERADFSRAETQ